MGSILAALFLVSSSSMAFEVLLTRYFSFAQWNHLSFLVVSIALLGGAAGGTVLSFPAGSRGLRADGGPGETRPQVEGSQRITARYALAFALSAPGSYLIVNALPFDYLRLPVQALQAVLLLVMLLLLALPFLASGLLQAQAYARHPQRSGSIYLAAASGSAGANTFEARTTYASMSV